MTDLNPLLDRAFAIPFDRILPEHVVPAVDQLLASGQAGLVALKADPKPRTWASTFGAFEVALEPLERAWGIVEHLRAVRHDDALAAAHGEVLPRITDFFAGLALDEELYAVMKDYAATEEARALTGPARRYLDRSLEGFRRSGADLPAEQKDRLRAIAMELAELGTKFSMNVLQATAAWELVVTDEAQLAGLPESARGLAAALAAQKGVEGWRFTLDAPSVISVLTYLDDASMRETVWRAYTSRCASGELGNGPVIADMIRLRREQAALLGYDDFADYVLAERMAKKGKHALEFLERIEARARPAFLKETEDLRAFRQSVDGGTTLAPWDLGYYAEKQRQALYDLDAEALRPYFAADAVMAGLFDLVGRLYGITITPVAMPSWHADAKTYEVRDADGTLLGAFYADLFPRPEKRAGAWMNALTTGGPRADGSFAPHLGLICGNMTPPVEGRPALLTHDEVETVFHEMGHLLHHLLSRVAIRGQAGTNVAWDFVELPSQIMENWCWTREGLDLFAKHWETGERLPDVLFDRMIAAKNFREGSAIVRQLGFGVTDLALHTRFDPAHDGDPLTYGERLMSQYAAVEAPRGHGILPTFQHLFSDAVGYAAGYYSYLWAAVLDADAFTRFEKEGLFSRTVGTAFRDAVLSKGDSDDPGVLIRNFLGRDPDPDALLRRSGLL